MALLTLTPFDPNASLRAFADGRKDAGALASCQGIVRGQGVLRLELQHYSGFTEAGLDSIEADARARFTLLDVLVIHRAGVMAPGEVIVLAAALSVHRKPGQEAVAYLMDRLKTDAPFWKREVHAAGARWIEPRSEDLAARQAWESPL
jgi:molybdopterin synthase catalytic subunit